MGAEERCCQCALGTQRMSFDLGIREDIGVLMSEGHFRL